ncbi:MAG: ABC transporter ATP-binding protein [candidate division NC10 bacterium]|nr:ABC transporter ATP-binding protein [candidate division NC10 bacterium]MBI4390830.1 ABC transporter ATP-binding protein [candidate division NC10 bacterium]
MRLAGVRKSFDSLVVLQGVDLAVAPGETITIIGGSGTGKSVLLRLIIGLIKPDAGRIWIDAEEVTGRPEAGLLPIRRKVGMLFQGAALFDSLTVAENVAFPLREHTRMSEAAIRERVREVLDLVGLPGVEEKEPAELSGGMKKRVGLARAIALQPRTILYDEPTTGLDPSNTEKIAELIMDLREKLGVTSVVVTHDMHTAFKVSDRLALLHQGRIAVAGTPAEIEHSDSTLVRDFISGHLEAG